MTSLAEDTAGTAGPQDRIPLNITDLNDDCLIKIFSYFTNYQLVSYLGICSRLDEIVHSNLRRCKSITFNFRYLNSDMEFKKLFRATAPYLTSIDFSVGYSIRTELVLAALKPITRCEKLKHLTLHYVTMCQDYLDLIGTVADHLEKIDFSFCLLTDELLEEFFKQHCRSLKELCLIGNYTFFGCSLVHLKGLRRLVLESHENFNVNLHLVKAHNPNSEIVIYEKGRLSAIDVNTLEN